MKITKLQLKRIIKEELQSVLKESVFDKFALGKDSDMAAMSKARGEAMAAEKVQRPRWTSQDVDKVYEKYWEEAVREIVDPYNDEEYEDYDPKSQDPETRSRVGFAKSWLSMLIRKNPSPSTQEIIEAIDEGWEEGQYEYREQQDMGYDDD